MTKAHFFWIVVLLAAVGAGAYWLGLSHTAPKQEAVAGRTEHKALFYRNPMNPAITSPVPAKDEMGMDYIPVYADEPKAERKPLFYRNPMNPAITSPVPAKDEMGMDYVPVYADEGQAKAVPGTVKIDPTIVQDIGVRTATATSRKLSRKIRTVGRVDYDEDGLVHVNLRSDGWVERLFVRETGQPVHRGQPLLSLYSPQIVSTEQEYLLAARGVASLKPGTPEEFAAQAKALLDSAAERLRLLGVPASEIHRLQEGGAIHREITLLSPATGIVQAIGVREGQFVSAMTETYRIADLSTVWVLADLYEDEVPWVRVGDKASVAIHGIPGDTRQARVDYVYPYLEGKTRTQTVRLELGNAVGDLKPDMYADVTLDAGRTIEAVTVPESAIVRSGTRDQVFVVAGPGRYEPRTVHTGVSADGQVQVLDGLQAGEQVVVSGSFLIDSESKLREAAAKMVPPDNQAQPAVDSGRQQ